MLVLVSKSPLAILCAAFFSTIRGFDMDWDMTKATTAIPMAIAIPNRKIFSCRATIGSVTSASSISASRTSPRSGAQYDEP